MFRLSESWLIHPMNNVYAPFPSWVLCTMLKYLIVPPPPIAENIHSGSSNLMRANVWSGCSALTGDIYELFSSVVYIQNLRAICRFTQIIFTFLKFFLSDQNMSWAVLKAMQIDCLSIRTASALPICELLRWTLTRHSIVLRYIVTLMLKLYQQQNATHPITTLPSSRSSLSTYYHRATVSPQALLNC